MITNLDQAVDYTQDRAMKGSSDSALTTQRNQKLTTGAEATAIRVGFSQQRDAITQQSATEEKENHQMDTWNPLALIDKGIGIYASPDLETFYYVHKFSGDKKSVLRVTPKLREKRLRWLVQWRALDVSTDESELVGNKKLDCRKLVIHSKNEIAAA